MAHRQTPKTAGTHTTYWCCGGTDQVLIILPVIYEVHNGHDGQRQADERKDDAVCARADELLVWMRPARK